MTLEQFKSVFPGKVYEFFVPEDFVMYDTWEWEWNEQKILMLKVPNKYPYGYYFKEEIVAQLRLQGLSVKGCQNGCIGIILPENKTKYHIFWSKYFKRFFFYFV